MHTPQLVMGDCSIRKFCLVLTVLLEYLDLLNVNIQLLNV